MRQVPAALAAFLGSKRPCYIADLFTFILYNGTTHYWTSSDQPVTVGATVFEAMGPILTRSQWNVKNSLEVPELSIALLSDETGSDPSTNMKLAIQNGLLDGGYIQLDRAYMPTFGDTSLGTILQFGGKTSDVSIGSKGAVIKVKGDNQIMLQYMPRNVFSLGCIHALYDVGCTLHAADFTDPYIVDTANQILIRWTVPPATPANYERGYVTMTSGATSGQRRSVQSVSVDGIVLSYPLYGVPAPGDTFDATFGCDLRKTTCDATFANGQNYRGFEFIPAQELGL